MLFNLDFANNTIFSCFFFFLIIDSYFLIPGVIEQLLNPTSKVEIPIGVATKEVKAEMETHPVTVKII